MPMEPETPIVRMPDPIERERPAAALNGFLGLLITVVGFAVLFFGGLAMTDADQPVGVLLVGAGVLFGLLGLRGLITVAPGQAKVLQFFGRYAGTVRVPGLRWVNPLTSRQLVSTRIRNHESAALKVNDADGNPIEIAAVVVWKVEDTARAVFEVDSFVAFVQTQTDTAIRHIATTYPYDSHGGGAHDGSGPLSLRENADAITGQLSSEISARVESAGVRIVESRLTHLAYAPEIAGAMLQRQQAGAVVAARTRIVDGAVGMVEMALDRLAEREVVELDEERKAAMVSNLLVVLCGDRATQPVINASSLYH
jgi:regulator of protease activity HflC (stomatin/prohibitin superfamily)